MKRKIDKSNLDERGREMYSIPNKYEKEFKRFKKKEETREKVWFSINRIMEGFGDGTWRFLTVVGFVLSQIFWVWLLRGFVTFFYNYLNFMSESRLIESVPERTFVGFFWIIYVVWFTIMVFSRFTIPIKRRCDECGRED